MKRNSFLKLLLAAGAFVATPFAVLAKRRHETRIDKGFKVDAGKDRFDKCITVRESDSYCAKISTKDTDGDMYVFETTRIKKGGPVLHYHYDQDEWWYVLGGEFIVKVGDETFHVKAGDSVFGPRRVPHAFAKVSEGEAKLLMIFQPAGKMEEYFKAVGEGVTSKLSQEEQDNFKKAHGFEPVGPALTY